MTDIAICRACGGANLVLFPIRAPRANRHEDPPAWAYHCRACGRLTPERATTQAAAEDVDWQPARAWHNLKQAAAGDAS